VRGKVASRKEPRFHVERMFRDAKLTQIFEGANQIQRMVVAREIIREKGLST